MIKILKRCTVLICMMIPCVNLVAQNPLIRDQYSADPTARVFGDRIYLFPSHDILAQPGKGRVGWFCMEDYHVFSSGNLADWTDHGMIVTQNKVAWVRPDSYSMWAPDCVFRNGKYYFYFPSIPADTTVHGRGFAIGVAVADKPEGPYTAEPSFIKGVKGIDPNVFIDDDGQAYLYWSQGNIYGAKLKGNMLELDSEVKTLGDLPTKGLKEGAFVFKRNGIYYMTYPHVENKIERLEYAIGDNPLGPFRFAGVIMDESSTGCWTNHHSLVEFHKQWYLFYHDRDYSPNFDKARSVRADSLSFSPDGTIRKVIPTLRGIGITEASSAIQIDRYSDKSSSGVSVDFIDTLNRFGGWKTVLSQPDAWIKYNTVKFSGNKSVTVRAQSAAGATLVIRSADPAGKIMAEIKVQKGGWTDIRQAVSTIPNGIADLVISLKDGDAEVDWVKFQ